MKNRDVVGTICYKNQFKFEITEITSEETTITITPYDKIITVKNDLFTNGSLCDYISENY